MAYNQENLYKTMIDVQAAFKKEWQPGMSIDWIFKNKIKDQFHISRTTFLKYLKTPAEKKLRELQQTKKEKKSTQISMFDK